MQVDEAKYIAGKRTSDGSASGDESFTWIGLVDASEAELQKYQRRFQLNNLAIEDAASDEQRTKLDIYPEHLFLVLKTIAYDLNTERIVVGDIAIFMSTDFVLTVRHGEAIALRSIRADLEKHPDRLVGGPSAVLHEIIFNFGNINFPVFSYVVVGCRDITGMHHIVGRTPNLINAGAY